MDTATRNAQRRASKSTIFKPHFTPQWRYLSYVLRVFYKYGLCLAHHPVWFLVCPVLACGGLATGVMFINPVNDLEDLYIPKGDRSLKDRAVMVATFPDQSAYNYNPFSQNVELKEAAAIFRSIMRKAVLSEGALNEIRMFRDAVLDLAVEVNGRNYTFEDVCVRRAGRCVISGGFVLTTKFMKLLRQGHVSYPAWGYPEATDLSRVIGEVRLRNNTLVAAGSLRIGFPLRQDTDEMNEATDAWELAYLQFTRAYLFNMVNQACSTSESLNVEVNEGTDTDLALIIIALPLTITYASISSAGGDCVSTRVLLAICGVMATEMGIIGSVGLISFLGVRFVKMCNVLPFLLLGIGVDDMYILMGSWSETLIREDLHVPQRIGSVFRKAGIGITITTLTHLLAFAHGSSSIFLAVRNFCLYSAAAILLCYICNITFFGACLTFHGRRVYAKRHTLTCQEMRKQNQLREEGYNSCYVHMCGGEIPSEPSHDQTPWEKDTRAAVIKLVSIGPLIYVIVVVFMCYLVVAIWGCSHLRQGIELTDMVPASSYYYRYVVWENEDFEARLPISFVTTTTRNYRDSQSQENVASLWARIEQDPDIDNRFTSCWFTSLANSRYYNVSSDEAFLSGLQAFLIHQPHFQNDIVFGPDNKTIIADRCHVYSHKIPNFRMKANLLKRMRDVADSSPTRIFAYHPWFIYYEESGFVLSSVLLTIGIALAGMFVVSSFFLPHLLIVLLILGEIIMIVTGVFGFMALWGVRLSSVTEVHLVLSVGYSADFCTHVAAAYLVSDQITREGRVYDAIAYATGPIINSGLSSLIGMVGLLFTESYLFQSFFKIMFLVITFGVLHAVFLTPALLLLLGPNF